MNEEVGIFVDKPLCLVDEVLAIKIKGVEPYSLVTVVATVTDQARFYSYATFKANEHGTVDIAKEPSIAGTYTGVEPMGLVWSMIQQPGQSPGRRLIKVDVTTPLVTTFAVFAGMWDGVVTLAEDFREKYCLASCTCERLYMAEGVERIPITDGRLHGTLFIPRGKGPFPGVLDMFGASGGTIEHRSALLASRGIASLALCYFLPNVITDLEYYVTAVEYLLAHPKVMSNGAGVVGVSKGSEMAYLLTIVCPKIFACINIGGSDRMLEGKYTYKEEKFYGDKDFPTIYWKAKEKLAPEAGLRFADLVNEAYSLNGKRASIPVERAKNAHFLIVHGADDQSIPAICADRVATRLRSFGKYNYSLVKYAEAGHLLEPPYAPHTYSSYLYFMNTQLIWGGKAKPHADAQEDFWRRLREHIHKHVPCGYDSSSILNKL